MTMLPVALVAKTGVDGLFAKKAVIIPGFLNRYLVASLRLLPRSAVVKLAKNLMSKK